ncbi:MAG: hypothetical protein IPI53_10265 [Saprospiraceae bacterium]|nr:hypothetical protein [Saprospiraceae bacterium]
MLLVVPVGSKELFREVSFIKAGFARKVLVIGTETLSSSRPHNGDSMIYSDGAGACVLESREGEYVKRGILSHATI